MSMQHNRKAGVEDSSNWHVARLERGGTYLEVVIHPDEAIAFKKGTGSIEDALQVSRVFTDAKKGMEASAEDLEACTGTRDVLEAASTIIRDGEIQVSPEYRAKQREQKHKQIVTWIHQNAINPTYSSKPPHPRDRIEAAMVEAKVRIDEHKTAEEQVEAIVDKIKPVLPIVVMTKQIRVKIPAEHAPKCYKLVHSYGKILKESWASDGSWIGDLEIPGGMEPDFYDKLNAATQGHNEVLKIQ